MRELVKLKKDNDIVIDSNLSFYLDPDYIYIPIKQNYQLLVKKGSVILKEQIIMENNLNKVISPISGKAAEIKPYSINGEMMPCLVIENDFKEKSKLIKKKSIKYEKEMLISKLYEYYFKYIASILETRKINNLVINGLEDEPYIYNNSFILNNYCKEILEMSDILSTHFGISRTTIAMKSSDSKNVEAYLSKVGTYPNITISLIEDKYLLGNPFFLRENIGLEEIDTLVLSALELYDIYNAIKYNKHITETFITISGPCVETSKIIRVKIGTLLSDAIKNNVKLKSPNVKYIFGGLMTGFACDINTAVITHDCKGVVIIENKEEEERKCISCGLCYRKCPVKVNPKKVMDTGKLSSNCIDCGLCSYLCPSHINLRKYLRGEHE